MATLSTFFDMVYVYATESSGHGPFTLGAAVTGFQTAAAAGITNGTPVSYRATDGVNWETAHGVIDVSGSTYTLTRGVDTIKSSNSNSLVSFGSGVTVLIAPLSQDINNWLSVGASQSFSSASQTQGRSNLGAGILGALNLNAYLSANQGTSSFTKVNLDTIVTDTQSAFDNSLNYRYTPKVAGLYLFSASVLVLSTTGGQCVAALYKNGSMVIFNQQNTPAANTPSIAICSMLAMNGSTDYVELWGLSPGGNFYGGPNGEGGECTQLFAALL